MAILSIMSQPKGGSQKNSTGLWSACYVLDAGLISLLTSLHLIVTMTHEVNVIVILLYGRENWGLEKSNGWCYCCW